MGLTSDQKQKIREYLELQGLSFKPLQDEMADHLTCDLELLMAEGHSFDTAWHQVTDEIEDNHFNQLQTQVMETINKRFSWSQGLSFLALALLLISTLFKALHLPLANELLIASFVFIAAALLTSALSGVLLNKSKQGGMRVLAMTTGILAMLVGYTFKLLHLPGADGLVLFATSILIATMVINALHVYRNASGRSNLLTYLHEKYTPGIERFLLVLLIPVLVYKAVMIFQGINAPAINFILLVVIFGSGLQFIAICWRTMETNLLKNNSGTLAAIMISSVCLMLPFLGPLVPLDVRIMIIVLFNIVAGWLVYTMEKEPRKIQTLIMICLVPLVFLGWSLVRLNLVATSAHSVFFNLPILVTLTAGLWLCRKHNLMMAYMLLSLSGYLLEYMI